MQEAIKCLVYWGLPGHLKGLASLLDARRGHSSPQCNSAPGATPERRRTIDSGLTALGELLDTETPYRWWQIRFRGGSGGRRSSTDPGERARRQRARRRGVALRECPNIV